MILLLAGLSPVVLKPVLQFDHWLFRQINQVWINPLFDAVLPFIRQQEFWYPFYLFLLVFAVFNYGKSGAWWVFAALMTVIISDLVSSSLVKHIFLRLRPCSNPNILDQVRVLVNECPQNSSFTSSHACNHFAAAWFIFITLNQLGSWRWILFIWASLICYAQIYVGVHYPLDIICGAILGTMIGYGMGFFFRKQYGTPFLK